MTQVKIARRGRLDPGEGRAPFRAPKVFFDAESLGSLPSQATPVNT